MGAYEAFASGCLLPDKLGILDELLNVNGGAISIGHPYGCQVDGGPCADEGSAVAPSTLSRLSALAAVWVLRACLKSYSSALVTTLPGLAQQQRFNFITTVTTATTAANNRGGHKDVDVCHQPTLRWILHKPPATQDPPKCLLFAASSSLEWATR